MLHMQILTHAPALMKLTGLHTKEIPSSKGDGWKEKEGQGESEWGKRR